MPRSTTIGRVDRQNIFLMIRIDIITCLPRLLDSHFAHSIMQRAQEKGHAEIVVHDLRNYGIGKSRQVDDYAFGGGAGMVMLMEPLINNINALKAQRKYDEIIYLTPDGKRLDQKMVNQFSLQTNLMMVCGHYKGIDERVREHFITSEISIGDYVLSGGELAASVLTDAIVRLVPGVLNDETSALTDSFQDNLLAPPVYTRPSDYEGMKVPEILLGGNTRKIDDWRSDQSLLRTKQRRPDLLGD